MAKNFNFYQSGQSLIWIVIVLVAVGLITGGLYLYLSKQIPEVPEVPQKSAEEKVITPSPPPTPPPTPAPTPSPSSNPTPTPSPSPSPPPTPSLLPYKMPVLFLSYFPLKDGKLDPDITGMQDDLSAIRAKVDRITNEVIDALEKGAVPSLDYYLIEKKEFLSAIPRSNNQIPWNPGVYRPDYYKILRDLNICNYVENQGVKEVWVWGYHYGNIEPAESNMAGPYGDISNSERIADMPVCAKTYTLYNYNYGRGTSEATEDHMHQIESVLQYVDYNLFWNKFVWPYGSQTETNHCGWAHYPPNGKSDYDWANRNAVWSDCEDWKPDGSGIKQQFNCEKWNCDSLNFFIWWMQNIPGANNNLAYLGKNLKNWWDFIGDFDRAMQTGKSLHQP